MVLKRKIVITPASNITSHTGRCILIARELKKRGFEITLAGSSKLIRNPQIVKEDEFEYYELVDFDQEEAMKILRTMRKAYSRQTLQEHLDSELGMLHRLKPDLVIVDFRLTMCVSAKVLKIPFISLLNARWLPQYFTGHYATSDSHPLPRFAKRILGKKMADLFWPYLVKLTLRYKLSPFPRAFRAHKLEVKRYPNDILVGDYNLILDTKLWGPTRNLPSNFKQVGPIIWTPELNLPTWINELDAHKRSIYVSMGTTGDKKLFQEIFKAFRDTEYQLIVSTGGQIEVDETMISENLHVERFLPGERVMEQVDAVICHGGSLTVYQAIKAATPCVVIATHLDQEWGGEEIQTHKAGIFLTMAKVLAKPSLIMESTKKMFDDLEEYQNNMKRLQEDLLRYDGLKDAVSGIEGFIQQVLQ